MEADLDEEWSNLEVDEECLDPSWLDRLSYTVIGMVAKEGETEEGDRVREALRQSLGYGGGSGICGKVWRKDELAYKCRSCERDPTCAICVECFREGNHLGHDYAMIRTGGGCCDCGDGQAWKAAGFCRKHRGASSEDEDPTAEMEPQLKERVKAGAARVSRVLLALAGKERRSAVEESIAFCVIIWLKDVAECGDAVRRIIGIELSGGWLKKMLELETRGTDLLGRRLGAALHGLYYVLITDLAFKRKFLQYFVRNYSMFHHALMNRKLLALWGISTSSETPSDDDAAMGVDFNEDIPANPIPLIFSGEDIENQTEDRGDILENFSVQLFTVPALVPVMIEHGLLDNMIISLLEVTELLCGGRTLDSDGGEPLLEDRMVVNPAKLNDMDAPLWRIMYDMRYVLTHAELARYLLEFRLDLFEKLLVVMSFLQGMGSVRRRSREHIEYENEHWTTVFTLELEFYHIVDLLSEAFAGSGAAGKLAPLAEDQRHRVLDVARRVLLSWIEEESLRRSRAGSNYSESFTLHFPLHRLFGMLAHSMLQGGSVTVEELVGGIHADPESVVRDALLIASDIARSQSFIAQIHAGMWNRNGREVSGQPLLYKSPYCVEWFVDLDIFLLQLAAIAAGPHEFEKLLCSHFECDTLTDDTMKSVLQPIGDEKVSMMRSLVETYLRLLISIVTERSRCGFSDVENFRRRLIHRLALSDQPHSHLVQFVPRGSGFEARSARNPVHGVVDRVIEEIAYYTTPREMEQGKYSLREELWKEFDPFNAHYAHRERVLVEQQYPRHLSLMNIRTDYLPFTAIGSRRLFPAMSRLENLSLALCERSSFVGRVLHLLAGDMSSSWVSSALRECTLLVPCLYLLMNGVKCLQQNPDKSVGSSGGGSQTPLGESIESLISIRKGANRDFPAELVNSLDRILGEVHDVPLWQSKVGVLRSYLQEKQDKDEEQERREKIAQAKRRQQDIIAKMKEAQASFSAGLRPGIAEVSGTEINHSNLTTDAPQMASSGELGSLSGSGRSGPLWSGLVSDGDGYLCVVCRESDRTMTQMGMVGFAQRSKVLVVAREQCRECPATSTSRKRPASDGIEADLLSFQSVQAQVEETSNALWRSQTELIDWDLVLSGIGHVAGVHVCFCGHFMHMLCFENYFSSLLLRQIRSLRYEGDHLIKLEKGEFLCPVCRRLGNILLPLFDVGDVEVSSDGADVSEVLEVPDFDQWLQETIQKKLAMADYPLAMPLALHPLMDQQERNRILGHANGVLFRLHSANLDDQRGNSLSLAETEWPDEAETQKRISRLWSATAVTICDLELESRLGQDVHDPRVALELTSNLIHASRAQGVSRLLGLNARAKAFYVLWNYIFHNPSRRFFSGDIFVAFLNLVLSWPGLLQELDLRFLARLSFALNVSRFGTNSSVVKAVRGTLVLLRKLYIVFCACFGKPVALPPLVQNAPDASSFAQFDFLCGELGIPARATVSHSSVPADWCFPFSPTHQGQGVGSLDLLGSSGVHSQNESETGTESSFHRHTSESFGVPRLVELPSSFQELLEACDRQLCLTCGKKPNAPCLCLLCRSIVCGYGKCGSSHAPDEISSSIGSTDSHAERCGAGIAVFIILKKTSVLLLRDERRSSWPSLYLDDHGEEDRGLRRGKPLWLSRERYDKLNLLWLTHGFDQNTKILSGSVRPGTALDIAAVAIL